MTLTDKQRKYGYIAAIIILLVHFGPRFIGQFIPQRPTEIQKPSPVRIAPAPGSATVPGMPSPTSANALAPADAEFNNLIGVWSGKEVRPNNTFCQMRLELRRGPGDPQTYSAYSTSTCGSVLPIHATTSAERQVAANVLKQMVPVATTFSGKAVNGVLRFNAVDNLGTTTQGCRPNVLVVSSFGLTQVSAEWKSDHCEGGQMLLQKTPFAPYLN